MVDIAPSSLARRRVLHRLHADTLLGPIGQRAGVRDVLAKGVSGMDPAQVAGAGGGLVKTLTRWPMLRPERFDPVAALAATRSGAGVEGGGSPLSNRARAGPREAPDDRRTAARHESSCLGQGLAGDELCQLRGPYRGHEELGIDDTPPPHDGAGLLCEIRGCPGGSWDSTDRRSGTEVDALAFGAGEQAAGVGLRAEGLDPTQSGVELLVLRQEREALPRPHG